MGQGHYSIAEIEKALRTCAPDVTFVLRKHRYWAVRGEFVYRKLSKGKGPKGQAKSDINVEDGRVRAMVRTLHLDEAAVRKHLPFAWS